MKKDETSRPNDRLGLKLSYLIEIQRRPIAIIQFLSDPKKILELFSGKVIPQQILTWEVWLLFQIKARTYDIWVIDEINLRFCLENIGEIKIHKNNSRTFYRSFQVFLQNEMIVIGLENIFLFIRLWMNSFIMDLHVFVGVVNSWTKFRSITFLYSNSKHGNKS